MRSSRLVVLLVLLIAVGLSMAFAEVPRLITYQGILTDGGGVPVPDASYRVLFRIYNDSTAGDVVWEEEQELTTLGGMFNVNLGLRELLSLELFAKYSDLFVALRLETGGELAPRTRLTSAAFAFQALNADSAGIASKVKNNVISSAMIKNGTISLVDLSQNGADSGKVIKWNGTGWGIDIDQVGDGGSGGGGWVDDGTVVRLETASDWVGIGTDAPAQPLHIAGPSQAGLDLQSGASGEQWRLVVPAGGGLRFHNIGGATNVLNMMPTGLVGITTSSPAARLHVNNFGAEDPFGVSISSQFKLIVKTTGRVGIGTSVPSAHLQIDETGSDDPFKIRVSSQTKFVVKNNAWVGINTATPMARLHIEEGGTDDLFRARLNGSTRFIIENAGHTGIGLVNPATRLHVNESGASDPFRVDVNLSTRFAVKNNGYVGIGTSNPASLLEVTGGTGSVNVLIEADTDNINEDHQPSLTFEQDGGSVEGEIGFFDGQNDFTMINRYSTGALHLGTNSATRLAIQSDGDVGIGDTNPGSHRLKVVANRSGSTGATARFINDHPAGIALAVQVTSTDLSCLISQLGSGDILRCDSYTGGWHPVFKVANDGTTTCTVLEITGGSDLAEPFAVNGSLEVHPGMVVCIDPDHPGELRIADSPYDPTVAGIISGANDLNPGLIMKQTGSIAEGSYPIALTGRVYCMVDAEFGEIKPGDFLTTSPTTGHAMKADDRERAYGTVIGKAMTGLTDGRGLVLVLVNLQ